MHASTGRLVRNAAFGFLLLLLGCVQLSYARTAEAEIVHFQEPFSPLNGSGSGLTLQAPSGLAIDEATGNVFLGETSNANRVAILGAAGGAPVGLASPFTVTGFTTANFAEPNGVAFDNNPSSPGFGTLYIADTRNAVAANRTVKAYTRNPVTERYEQSGDFVPALIGSTTRDAKGVALDPDGDVWVAEYQQKAVIEFAPDGTELQRIDVSHVFPHALPTEEGRPKSVAISVSGDIFVMGFSRAAGHPRVVKWVADGTGEIDPSENPVVVPDTAGAHGMALDRSENALYIVFEDRVVQYDATSLIKEGEFGRGVLVGGRGIAVNESNGRVYVSDNGAGRKNVVVYGPSIRTAVVEVAPATGIGTSAATLHGSVNAEGSPLSFCRFEYGTSDEYGETAPCSEIVPPDSKPHAVSAALSGLESNTTYHYRLVAENASGIVSRSADATFTTLGKPRVTEPLPIWVEGNSAKVGAYVNPSGFATNYRFEWGPTDDYGRATPADIEPAIPAGTEPVKVVANLTGLNAGTAYHFRVVAENAAGLTFGADQRFETLNSCGFILDRCLELASAGDKGLTGSAGDALGGGFNVLYEAASSGSSVVYPVAFGFADATAGGEVIYRSERGAGSWAPEQLSTPVTAPTSTELVLFPSRILRFSRDMSCYAVLTAQPLTPDAPRATTEAGFTNLFLRHLNGQTQVVTNLPLVEGLNPAIISEFTGHVVPAISDDCGKLVFHTNYRYPGLAGEGDFRLYEWDRESETLRAISEVPGPSGMQVVPVNPGSAGRKPTEAPGSELGAQMSNRYRAMSADGRRVFFTAQRKLGDGPAGAAEVNKLAVFARIDGSETVDISQSQTGTPNAGALYQLASRDGSRVLFTANYGLTEAPDPGWPSTCDQQTGSGCDLYEYDFSRPEGERLVDLSLVDEVDNPGGAGVAGVAAASEDATKVYFFARGRLVPGKGPTEARNLADGTYSLYLRSEEGIEFVGVVGDSDPDLSSIRVNESSGIVNRWTAQATPSGDHLVFQASANVTGDEPSGVMQAYRFDAESGKTVCVSCLRSGGQPVSQPGFNLVLPQFEIRGKPRRSITDDGRSVFFTKLDVLAPGAVEGRPNLYEWRDGQITFLGSSFEAKTEPGIFAGLGYQFIGASADGTDVYFTSRDRLTWDDRDDLMDIYDVRIGGGIPQPPPQPAPCDPGVEDSCQSPQPSAALPAGAGSAIFSGPGNVAAKASPKRRCPRGKRLVKSGKRHRCVKKVKKKKRGKHQRNRRAGNGRGAGK